MSEFSTPEFWQKRIQENHGKLKAAVQSVDDWPRTEEGHKKIMASHLTGKVIDLGCGYGRVIDFLPDTVTEYLGIDVCPEFIEEAKKLYPSHNFILGDFRKDLSHIKDQEFDWALIIGCYSKQTGPFRDELEKTARRVAKKTLILWLSKPEDFLILYA